VPRCEAVLGVIVRAPKHGILLLQRWGVWTAVLPDSPKRQRAAEAFSGGEVVCAVSFSDVFTC